LPTGVITYQAVTAFDTTKSYWWEVVAVRCRSRRFGRFGRLGRLGRLRRFGRFGRFGRFAARGIIFIDGAATAFAFDTAKSC
jgi:hypothetical protein